MTKWVLGVAGTVLAGILVWTVTQVLLPWVLDKPKVDLPTSRIRIKITSPIDTVRREVPAITGTTSYLDRNHYIVVTAPTGDNFIEDGPLKVSERGIWTGHATFGTAGVGNDKQYTIRIMATTAALSTGPITNIPKDAIFSDPVTVRRID